MGINKLKQLLVTNLKNIPGKRIADKIVIIECDDWGGIRMPSKSVRDKLLSKNIAFDQGHYDKYDTLEDKQDIEPLFDLLLSIKDRTGNPAVITPFVNVANPDFAKIKESGYDQYFYEIYPHTLARYGRDSSVMPLWQKGIELNIFVPEYHGREHLTVPLWINELKRGNKEVRAAFEYEYTNVIVEHIHPIARGFRPEFFFDNNDQKQFLASGIKDGALIFEKLFGYAPHAFIPGNSVFHPDFEKEVIDAGLKYLTVDRQTPIPDGLGNVTYTKNYYTKYQPDGLTKYLRNCAFEPTGPEYQGIGLTMSQVEAAFRWSKPAIISTHRVNFVGGNKPGNREKGLSELQILLKAILSKWPDVKFMSTKEFIKYKSV